MLSPKDFRLTDENRLLLNSILDHLFPADSESPGASAVHAGAYIGQLIIEQNYSNSKKKLFFNGLRWTEVISQKQFHRSFIMLDEVDREVVLRKLDTYKKGRKFISNLLTLIFEALLADPVYEVNVDSAGWKWLNHIPGEPRPQKRMYS